MSVVVEFANNLLHNAFAPSPDLIQRELNSGLALFHLRQVFLELLQFSSESVVLHLGLIVDRLLFHLVLDVAVFLVWMHEA